MANKAQIPTWYQPSVLALPDLETLGFSHEPGEKLGLWVRLNSKSNLEALVYRILPSFLSSQRRFSSKENTIACVAWSDSGIVPSQDDGYQFSFWDIKGTNGRWQRYLLPLAVTWERQASEAHLPSLLPLALAKIQVVNRIGVLHDALASETFPDDVLYALLKGLQVQTVRGQRIIFTPSQTLWTLESPTDLTGYRIRQEQSNTLVRVGQTMVLKIYQRIEEGVHPEVEIGDFLTNVAHFTRIPPLLGTVELVAADGTPTALAILQGFVDNQGNGWAVTLDYLNHYLDKRSMEEQSMNDHTSYLTQMETLGQRVAQLHRAFSLFVEDPAFAPEKIQSTDLKAWRHLVQRQAEHTRQALQHAEDHLNHDIVAAAEALLAVWARIELMTSLPKSASDQGMKTRYHGDLHLGQVVLVKDDFYFLDFEGEPLKDIIARRAKHSPLKDVAGVLRSFNYAGCVALLSRVPLHLNAVEAERSLVDIWEEAAKAAFLKGYFDTADNMPFLPGNPAARQWFLDLFVLEKALYEICYEVVNRPDWLCIPVQGVHQLLDAKG